MSINKKFTNTRFFVSIVMTRCSAARNTLFKLLYGATKTPSGSCSEGASYVGENIASDIRRIIADFKPAIVLMPHPNDRHPDHFSIYAFVKYVLVKLNDKPEKELLYLVHRGICPPLPIKAFLQAEKPEVLPSDFFVCVMVFCIS